MTYVPKRKRRIPRITKVFLYSSTLLSVVGSYGAPAVNVLADTQTPVKADAEVKNDSATATNHSQTANAPTSAPKAPANSKSLTNGGTPSQNSVSQISPRTLKTYQVHLKVVKIIRSATGSTSTEIEDAPVGDQNRLLESDQEPGTDITTEFDNFLTSQFGEKYGRAARYSGVITVPTSGNIIEAYVSITKGPVSFKGYDTANNPLYFDSERTRPIEFTFEMLQGDRINPRTKLNTLTNQAGAEHFRVVRGIQCTNVMLASGQQEKIELEKDISEKISFVLQGDESANPIKVTPIYGWPGDRVDLTDEVPRGYELCDLTEVQHFIGNTDGQEIKLPVKVKSTVVNNPVEFIDVDQSNLVIPTGHSISGISGTAIPQTEIDPILQSSLGADYQYVNNTYPSINFRGDGAAVQIPVEKKAIDNTLIYQDHGTTISSKVLNGKIGTSISAATIQTNLPLSTSAHPWELVSPSTSLTFDRTNSTHQIAITRKYTNKIQLCHQGQPLLGNDGQPIMQDLVGYVDDPINPRQINPSLIPAGYKLPATFPSLKIQSPDDTVQVLNLELDPIPGITNFLNYVDENNQPIGPQDSIQITGSAGSTITTLTLDNNNPDPVHYELDPIKPQPNLMGTTGTKLTVHLRGKIQEYKFIFQNEAGSQVGLAEHISGRYGNSAAAQIKSKIPNGYILANETAVNSLKFGNSNEITVIVKTPTNPTTFTNYLNYVDENNQPVGPQDSIQITRSAGSAISNYDLISRNPDPAHYELDSSKTQPQLVGPANTKLTVHLRGREQNYQLIYQDGDTEVYRVNDVSGRFGRLVGNLITQNLPRNYSLKNSNLVNTLKFGDSTKIIINVTSSFTPNAPDNPVSQPIRNYVQFTVDNLYFGDKITVWGDYGNLIDFRKFLPNGYELKEPQNATTTFQIAETVHYIPIQKIPTVIPEPQYNYIQFMVDGKNWGNQIKVMGAPGTTTDLRSILPSGYELLNGVNPLVTLGPTGTVNYIPLKKIVSPTFVTNYLQFMVNGTAFKPQQPVTGRLGDIVNFKNLIPAGYEAEDPNQIIKFASAETVHLIPIKKVKTPEATSEVNYIQFTVAGLNLGKRKVVRGTVGDKIELQALIPTGYKLTKPQQTLFFGIAEMTHFVEVQKIASVAPQSVSNYLQFTLEGKKFHLPIKRMGKIGDPIQVIPWIPQGYQLKDPSTNITFGPEGKIHYLSIIRSKTENTVTNYLQFTVAGQKRGNPIKVIGKIGANINLGGLVPVGFALSDPQIKLTFGPDQALHRIAIEHLTTLNYPLKIHHEKPNSRVGTATKYGSLPQLGDQKAKTIPLGLTSIASAGTAAIWLSIRKKKRNPKTPF